MYQVNIVGVRELDTRIVFQSKKEALDFASVAVGQMIYTTIFVLDPAGELLAKAHSNSGEGLQVEETN